MNTGIASTPTRCSPTFATPPAIQRTSGIWLGTELTEPGQPLEHHRSHQCRADWPNSWLRGCFVTAPASRAWIRAIRTACFRYSTRRHRQRRTGTGKQDLNRHFLALKAGVHHARSPAPAARALSEPRSLTSWPISEHGVRDRPSSRPARTCGCWWRTSWNLCGHPSRSPGGCGDTSLTIRRCGSRTKRSTWHCSTRDARRSTAP